MRSITAGLALAFVVTICTSMASWQAPGTGAEQPSVTLPADLDRVLRDYEKAWSARDPKTLAALFHEDGFVLPNGKMPVRGRAAIAEHYNGQGGPLSLRAIAFAVEGKVAWIIGGYGGEAGKPDSGKFTLSLRKADDRRWLIAGDMDSPNQRR